VNATLRAFLDQTRTEDIVGAITIVEHGRVRRRAIG
jgi:hypothetical protein